MALCLLIFFFNISEEFIFSLLAFFLIITPAVLICGFVLSPRLNLGASYNCIFYYKKHKAVVCFLCILIVLSGPLDVYINGFKLLNPSTYADFNGVGRYVRHISSLCWILAPIALILIRNKWIKRFLIVYALVFPVLIIDRNRLFMAFYSLLLCLYLIFDSLPRSRSRQIKKYLFWLVLIFGIFVFLLIGYFRSGDAFIVESSGDRLSEGAYPLSDVFFMMPTLFQQLILYVTTPIFNFATIVFYDFTNHDFLLSQLAPFSRDTFDTYPYAPVMVARFNVGTEFYPFLLYGGLQMVFFAFIFMLLSFIAVARLLRKHANIFTFLIFLKISYSAIFMGFAPQFFILLNLMFVIMMLSLWFFSSLLGSALRAPSLAA